uniref:Uncharacterized protein n=1 Tax=Anguilla anguilla TaxID=7936 RepID=A0A0E9UGE9_ANGAN
MYVADSEYLKLTDSCQRYHGNVRCIYLWK